MPLAWRHRILNQRKINDLPRVWVNFTRWSSIYLLHTISSWQHSPICFHSTKASLSQFFDSNWIAIKKTEIGSRTNCKNAVAFLRTPYSTKICFHVWRQDGRLQIGCEEEAYKKRAFSCVATCDRSIDRWQRVSESRWEMLQMLHSLRTVAAAKSENTKHTHTHTERERASWGNRKG